MAVDPKQHIHALIDRLNDDEARDLSTILDTGVTALPLMEEDLLLDAPSMPADESADELIATVRRWRREGGDARAADYLPHFIGSLGTSHSSPWRNCIAGPRTVVGVLFAAPISRVCSHVMPCPIQMMRFVAAGHYSWLMPSGMVAHCPSRIRGSRQLHCICRWHS